MPNQNPNPNNSPLHIYKHVYEPPTLNEIRELYPNYSYPTTEQFIQMYHTETEETPAFYAKFALEKLYGVTTSLRLTPEQEQGLIDIKNGDGGWAEYCTILKPKQLFYVGI